MKIHLLIAVLLSALLSACGGDHKKNKSHTSSSSTSSAQSSLTTSSSPTTLVGVLVDAFVAGAGYRTPTQSGVTNAQGEFNYLPGESVTFFIGSLEFPPIPAKSLVTPLDMAQSLDPSSPVALNIARLLQSLDTDGNPANGISISVAATQAATQVDFTLDLAQFASSPAVINLIANSGSVTTTLVSAEQALTHLRQTLVEAGVPIQEASSSSQASVAPSAFDPANGWASVGTNNLGGAGTTGGVDADEAHTYTVTNRNELIAALYLNEVINNDGSFSGTVDTAPKIIYVEGAINLNMNKALVEQTEADYICPIDGSSIKVAYTFQDYASFYDPTGAWGTAPVSGDLETARSCAATKQKAVIQIKIGSNTTIIGKGNNAKILRGHVRLSPPYDNIIIRNIQFEDAYDMFPQWDPADSGGRWNSAYDNISVEGATHVWIDHCTFSDGANLDKLHPPVFAAPYNLPEMKVQHHDGAIDVTKNSNYVTLSYNHIHDHDKTHLIGSSDSIAADNGPRFLKITMHHNYLKDVSQRLPRVRMGQVHVYNNLYDGQLKPVSVDRNYGFSVGLATGQFGKMYAENNVFEIAASTEGAQATVENLYSVAFKQDAGTLAACTTADYTAADCSTLFYETGSVLNGVLVDVMAAAVANAAAQTTPLTLNSAATYWIPSNFYNYHLDTTGGLRNVIIATAGAGQCTDCTNTIKPVPSSSSSAASGGSDSSTGGGGGSAGASNSSASPEEPIPMNCGADVYFCDDFSASSVANWNLKPVASVVGTFDLFTQNSNQMLRYTAGSAGGVLALVKPAAFTGVTSGDYYVEARIRPRNNGTTSTKQLYIIARAQDAKNWYGAGLNVQGSTADTRVAIGKMVNGVLGDKLFPDVKTPIEQGARDGTDGVWYTVRVEVKGSSIVVYLNGQPLITGTDTSFSSAGLIGLYTTNKSFEIDDVKVGNADIKPVQFTVVPAAPIYTAEAGDLPYTLAVTAKNSLGATDTFTAVSSDTGVVDVSVVGDKVSLNPVGAGVATITLTSGADPSKTHVISANIAPQFVMPVQTYDLTGRVDPVINEANAYVDTRLSITFDSPPTLGTTGRIRIFKVSDDSIVDTLALSDNTDSIGYAGQGVYRIVKNSPLSISGNTLTIAVDGSKFAYGTAYYVAIAEGVVTGTSLNGTGFVGLGKAAGWSFTTKTAAPVTGNVTVDDNGVADFRTVQGAINHVVQTVAKDTAATISIKNGDYRELLFLRGKNNLTLQGESRDGVVIHYTNNEGFNSGTGTSQAAGASAGGRSVFLVETSDMLKLDSLTIKNDTLIGAGGQAEVIYFNNDLGRLVATNAAFISEQDTIQVKGYSWFYRSLIAGNVDFIWGNNRVALFEESEIRTLGHSTTPGNGGYILQARTVTAADKGFVFLNSKLTRGAGPAGNLTPDGATWLARSGGQTTYFDNIVFVNTRMDAHINPAGWSTSPMPNPAVPTATSGWREFASMNPAGTTLDVSARTTASKQLAFGEIISSYCNRVQIFAAYSSAAGWNPLPGESTDCLNYGTSSSSNSSGVATSAVSDSSSSVASDTSSSPSSGGSASAQSGNETSSSASSVYVPTTTSWLPTYNDLQSAVASSVAANTNVNFNATATPGSAGNIKFYSVSAGSLRLHLNSAGTAYAINYNGTALKSDVADQPGPPVVPGTPVALVEGTSGQVNPTSLNVAGGVTRFVSVPLVASSQPVTLAVTYSNASNNYDASTQPNGCLNGQIAIVDQTGKTWKVASACGTTQSLMSVTISDASVTELFVLMTRNNDTVGGIRIWKLDVTR